MKIIPKQLQESKTKLVQDFQERIAKVQLMKLIIKKDQNKKKEIIN